MEDLPEPQVAEHIGTDPLLPKRRLYTSRQTNNRTTDWGSPLCSSCLIDQTNFLA